MQFSASPGFEKQTSHDAGMERVDDKGNIIAKPMIDTTVRENRT